MKSREQNKIILLKQLFGRLLMGDKNIAHNHRKIGWKAIQANIA